MSRIFISGSTTGLGLMAGELLASQGHRVVLHARNADRAADARRALPKAEAVVVGYVETSGTARPPHRNLRRDFRRAAAGLSWPTVRTSHVVIDGTLIWHSFVGTERGTVLMVAPHRKWH